MSDKPTPPLDLAKVFQQGLEDRYTVYVTILEALSLFAEDANRRIEANGHPTADHFYFEPTEKGMALRVGDDDPILELHRNQKDGPYSSPYISNPEDGKSVDLLADDWQTILDFTSEILQSNIPNSTLVLIVTPNTTPPNLMDRLTSSAPHPA